MQHQSRHDPNHAVALREQEHRPDGPRDLSQHPKQRRPHKNTSESPRHAHPSRRKNATPNTLNILTERKCKKYIGATLRGQSKRCVWLRGMMKYILATPGNHGNLQSKIAWQGLQEWGDKFSPSNFELWDDRPFPECPLQLCTPENQVAPGTVWTGDLPEAGLEEPNIPDEQQLAAAISHKLRLGRHEKPINRTHAKEVTTALVTPMSQDEPGVMYDTNMAWDLQDIPVMTGCILNATLWQELALKTHMTNSNLSPVLTRTGYQ